MEILFVIVAVFIVLPLTFLIVQHNGLVMLKNHIADAWANIDTELKRRHDLIPNLVAAVKGYAKHEKEVLAQVVELRQQCLSTKSFSEKRDGIEAQLGGALSRMLAVVESHPDLKADQNFLQLQRELTNTEDRIQAARRFYNGNVRDYRNKCQSFPSNIVAAFFGFNSQDFFSATEIERQNPDIEFTS